MALIPLRPFDLDRFFEDEDFMLPVFSTFKTFPEMDLYETDKEIVAEISAPGIDPQKTEILIENGYLKVKGEGEERKEEKKKDYWRKEISRRAFERTIRLPQEVDEDKVEATYEKGILKIVMPKKEATKSKGKKIEIKEK